MPDHQAHSARAQAVRVRERYRLAVRAVTGVTGAGLLAATGWIAAAEAADHQALQEAEQAAHDAAAAQHALEQAEYEAAVAAFEAQQRSRVAAVAPSRLAPAPEVIKRTPPPEPRVTQTYVPPVDTSVGGGGDVGDGGDSGGGSGGSGGGSGSGGGNAGGGSGGGASMPDPAPPAPPPPPPPPPPSSGS